MIIKEILKLYNFHLLPRTVGIPQQFTVFNFSQIENFFKRYNGKKPLYISHNTFSGPYIYYSNIFFDFDRKEGLENELQKEVLSLAEYFKDNNWKFKINFTGNSFHVFLYVKPFTAHKNNIDVKKFQRSIKDELNLKFLDLNSAEPKKLTRMPLSRYVKDDIITDKYVIPISIDQLTWDYKDIVEDSQNMVIHLQNGGEEADLKDMLWREVEFIEDKQNIFFDWYKLPDDKFKYYVKIIVNNLYDEIFSTHPSNTCRFLTVLKIKNFGIDMYGAIQIINRISDMAKWDNRNVEAIEKHVRYIYSENYKLVRDVYE